MGTVENEIKTEDFWGLNENKVGKSFFLKNLRIQFDVVFDSESCGGIFDSLTPFGGEFWRFENLKFVRHLQLYKIFCLNW